MKLSKKLSKGIIIDAEAFKKFLDTDHEDSKPVHQCIKKGTLQLVYGDDPKSSCEIKKFHGMVKLLNKFKKRGEAYLIQSKEKKEEIDSNNKIVNGVELKSNDTHIIAVALVEQKARLLFSTEKGDTDLHNDFTNPKIIKPQGKVYKRYSQRSHLLPS